MARFRDADEFGPTVDAAAERLRISATAVEKDCWVSQVLRILADEFDGSFIFKGGTSLSKAYEIIECVSEDIDVLLLPGGRGRSAVDTLMRKMSASAATGVDGTTEAVRPLRERATPGLRGALSVDAPSHRAHPVEHPAGDGCTRWAASS